MATLLGNMGADWLLKRAFKFLLKKNLGSILQNEVRMHQNIALFTQLSRCWTGIANGQDLPTCMVGPLSEGCRVKQKIMGSSFACDPYPCRCRWTWTCSMCLWGQAPWRFTLPCSTRSIWMPSWYASSHWQVLAATHGTTLMRKQWSLMCHDRLE